MSCMLVRQWLATDPAPMEFWSRGVPYKYKSLLSKFHGKMVLRPIKCGLQDSSRVQFLQLVGPFCIHSLHMLATIWFAHAHFPWGEPLATFSAYLMRLCASDQAFCCGCFCG